jgi:hypothetical protein
MSMFRIVPLPCPRCGNTVNFNAVVSVNADRRPDLRAAILDASFQRQACPQCSTEFRLDPELTYMDVGRGQWIAAFPITKLRQWQEVEARAQDIFNQAYGERASKAARDIGAGMTPRVTFGWSAVREKIAIVENALDDVTMELAKAAMVRGVDPSPVGPGTELRFLGIDGATMAVAWLNSADEGVRAIFQVPCSLYDGIAADPSGWETLRAEVSGGMFVDMNRMLVVGSAVPV